MKKTIENIKKSLDLKTNNDFASLMGISTTALNNIISGKASTALSFSLRLLSATLKLLPNQDAQKLRKALYDAWSSEMKNRLELD